jgi:ABC-type transporter Mla MlaB component
MIRIDVVAQTPHQVVLRVQGLVKLADRDLLAEEVGRWLAQGAQVVLDLKGVEFIDREGVVLLQQWATAPPRPRGVMGERLVLRNGTLFIRHLLEAHGLRVHE